MDQEVFKQRFIDAAAQEAYDLDAEYVPSPVEEEESDDNGDKLIIGDKGEGAFNARKQAPADIGDDVMGAQGDQDTKKAKSIQKKRLQSKPAPRLEVHASVDRRRRRRVREEVQSAQRVNDDEQLESDDDDHLENGNARAKGGKAAVGRPVLPPEEIARVMREKRRQLLKSVNQEPSREHVRSKKRFDRAELQRRQKEAEELQRLSISDQEEKAVDIVREQFSNTRAIVATASNTAEERKRAMQRGGQEALKKLVERLHGLVAVEARTAEYNEMLKAALDKSESKLRLEKLWCFFYMIYMQIIKRCRITNG